RSGPGTAVTLSLPYAALRERVTALARAAAWGEVATVLAAHASDGVRDVPELLVLRAESLLRIGRPRDARDLLTGALDPPALRRERVMWRRATNLLGAAHFALGEL